MILFLLKSVIALVTLLTLTFYWRKRRYLTLPSPPWLVPWVGHLPLLWDTKNDPVNHLAELYRKYSRHGILYTHIFGIDHVLVGDYQVLKNLFNNPAVANRGQHDIHNNIIHRKWAVDRSLNPSDPLFGIVMNQGPSWQEQRRQTIKLLKENGYGKNTMEHVVANETHKLLKVLEEEENTPVNMDTKFNLAALNVLWATLAGHQYEYNNPRLHEMFGCITKYFQVANLADIKCIFHMVLPPWLYRMFPAFLGRNFPVQVCKMVMGLLEVTINEHKETLDHDNPRDFIDGMLINIDRTTDPTSSFYQKQGETNLKNTVLDLFFAGTETSATSLTWAILYMIREPEIQAKVHQELDEVIGKCRLPMYSDRHKLPYTEAVIWEIMRCANIAPLAVQHFNSTPVTLFGKDGENVVIPKDTMVSPLLGEILKGDEWNANNNMDAKTFRPERFLDSSGKLVTNERLIPFGIGKRRCLGESLARVELFQFFAGILQHYSLLPEHPDTPPSDTEYIMGLTVTPKPFKCIFKPRF